jgi:hypothetical protein
MSAPAVPAVPAVPAIAVPPSIATGQVAAGPHGPVNAGPVQSAVHPISPNPVVQRVKTGIPAGLVVQRGPWRETPSDVVKYQDQLGKKGGMNHASYVQKYMERHFQTKDTPQVGTGGPQGYTHDPKSGKYVRNDLHHKCGPNEYWDEKTKTCRRKTSSKHTSTGPEALNVHIPKPVTGAERWTPT